MPPNPRRSVGRGKTAKAGIHVLRVDGAARGNPGPAGIGVILEDPQGRPLANVGKGIGWATNNAAEYKALLEGLNLALSRGISEIHVVSDSVLVVQQMSGNYKVRSSGLRPLHAQARDLAGQFRRITYESVLREANSKADRLANMGIDEWLASNPDYEPPDPPQPELF